MPHGWLVGGEPRLAQAGVLQDPWGGFQAHGARRGRAGVLPDSRRPPRGPACAPQLACVSGHTEQLTGAS